jgi:hypothetical protein
MASGDDSTTARSRCSLLCTAWYSRAFTRATDAIWASSTMTDSSSVVNGPPAPPSTTITRPVDPDASASGTANHGVAGRTAVRGPAPSA